MAKNAIALQTELSKAFEKIKELEMKIEWMKRELEDKDNILTNSQNLLTKHLRRETHFFCFIKAMEREAATLKFNLNTQQ